MITPKTPLLYLYGVGEKVAQKLEQLNLYTVEDLIYNFPWRYEDFTHPRTINELVPGEHHIIEARVLSVTTELSHRKRMKLTRALVADRTGQISLLWFNQPFLGSILKEGTTWLFAGRVERDHKGNLTMVSPDMERQATIIPVYHETAGLSSKIIRKLIFQLKHFIDDQADWLPESIRQSEGLVGLVDAFNMMHFPTSIDQVAAAKKRLAFDELFLLVAGIQLSKQELNEAIAPTAEQSVETIKQFTESLPFSLTDSQRRASWQILQDLAKPRPMNRLLEGDVGSGKTVVGALAAYVAAKSGYIAVWMAPTEILANQHFQTCERLLSPFGISVGLLTGSTAAQIRPKVNEFQVLIGTQALIQEGVQINDLALIIVDEQHRFGVKQRAKLLNQEKAVTVSHFLSMTATPIPRTLALTLYGDLDISRLDSVPTGRLPVITRLIDPAQRLKAYQFIRAQIQAGRQAYVVCPLVDDTGQTQTVDQLLLGLDEKKAAVKEHEKLSRQIFPDLRVGLLHGKLKPKEKATVMAAFKNHELDILVATSVIEVGIDVPNATVMMIEGADRFGLAQLHQFRGRVGRGQYQSYCFVFTDSTNPAIFERLQAFTEAKNGFEIAELDLKLRGPGQLVGLEQSGHLNLKIASLSDIDLIQQVKKAVVSIIDSGLDRYPELVSKLQSVRETEHLS